METSCKSDLQAIAEGVRDVCGGFGGDYWRGLEERGAYPEEFVRTLSELGWLSILIPIEYGGGGRGITEAAVVLEEIHRSGANANACHAQMYIMGTLLRHGTLEQKKRYLPDIASGSVRLQAFAVTEPDAGSDTTQTRTRAERRGNGFLINGQKIFISRVAFSDLMLLLARTSPASKRARTDGLSVFIVDLRDAGESVEFHRIPMMFNHHTYQVFFNDVSVPEESLVGQEGQGFRYIVDGWNAERCLIASEAIGDGHFFIDRAVAYASERTVFSRPVGENQGVQFPLAQAYAQIEAASLMRFKASNLFDQEQACAPEANMAKLLASQASWQAANAAMMAYGGNGFASEYDIERKFRETKLLEIAPVNNNLILAYLGQRVLGLPRSY